MGIRVITLSGSGTVVDAQPHPRNPFVAVAKSGSDLLDLNYALPEHGSLAPAVGFGGSFPCVRGELIAVCLGNQANSATTRTDFFTAVCWQFCWHYSARQAREIMRLDRSESED